MTQVVRLTLVSHATTQAMTSGRFPADEPLNDAGRRQLEGADGLDVNHQVRQFAGPEQRVLQTAHLLRLQPRVEPRLADLDYGRWCGRELGSLHPEELEVWLTDPAAAPHGGESIVVLIDRVAGWLDSLTRTAARTVAVTHPAVVRAAILLVLDAPPKSFWRIDVAPASRIVMHFRGHAWTLRSTEPASGA